MTVQGTMGKTVAYRAREGRGRTVGKIGGGKKGRAEHSQYQTSARIGQDSILGRPRTVREKGGRGRSIDEAKNNQGQGRQGAKGKPVTAAEGRAEAGRNRGLGSHHVILCMVCPGPRRSHKSLVSSF